MITSLIGDHLNSLFEASIKGISSYDFESITILNRLKITEITRKVELGGTSWNKVLSSQKLIDFVNNTTISDEILDQLFKTRFPASEIETVLDSSFFQEVYDRLSEGLKARNTYYYSNRDRLSFPDWFLDTLAYLRVYSDTPLEELVETVSGMNSIGYMEYHYPKMRIDERVRLIRLWGSSYLNVEEVPWDERLEIYKDCIPHIEFFEALYEVVGEPTSKKIFSVLQGTLRNSENAESLCEDLKKLLYTVSPPLLAEWFEQLYGEQDLVVLDSEIQKLSENVYSRDSTNVYAVIYGEQSLASDALKHAHEYAPHHINLLKHCIESRKKGFLRLILNEKAREVFVKLTRYNLLFTEEFRTIINLNSLSERNLVALSIMIREEEHLRLFNMDIPLTFEEFQFLYGKSNMDIDFYYSLIEDFTVGERLRIARELPELKTVRNLYQTDEDLFAAVKDLVKVMPMKQWVKEKHLCLSGAEDHHFLKVLLLPSLFEKFLTSLKKGSDVDFILNERELLAIADSLDEAKLMFVQRNKACQFLFEKLNVSSDFIQKYKVNIVDYYERGLCEIFQHLYQSKKFESYQLQNLNLITKAELSGKLKEIKFVQEDFELEIGMPVTNQVIKEWMRNRSIQMKEILVHETYDYETTLRLGQYPVETCQHWDDGKYSRCLLSNFDTNKKVIVAKGRKGHVVARAIIRLTKGSEKFITKKEPFKSKRLGFKDVEAHQEGEVIEDVIEPKEELILFLERCYTNMDGEHGRAVRREIVKLAMEKSKELGAKLVLADEYASDDLEELNSFVTDYFHIFISFSKNGFQYLDSLSGQAIEENEGHFNKGKVMFQVAAS
ncbi:hypothetical protein EHV15_34700 [Paenibacillus oralis]|uniref:Uncharacterized protein n=1 Tax=Paenibacillus oralis TaxID=2490856 RepID=A0A3P3T9N3_9BACL|nr:hypothetical protein [Paenibacillus oralis]RRJ54746.1 hypothetical protein EHV15_34700 [Paenibacillus oralis]